MLQYLYFARWDQAYDVLTAGNPPMFVRLLALNALFLVILIARKASGARPMPAAAALLVQLAAVGANIAVLYQKQVQDYLTFLIYRL